MLVDRSTSLPDTLRLRAALFKREVYEDVLSAEIAKLSRVTVEHLNNPVGVRLRPSFGWARHHLAGDQNAYRITVVAAGEVVWDSGLLEGDLTTDVPYSGPDLAELTPYRVRIRSRSSSVEAVGEATFVTGVLAIDGVFERARWIGGSGDEPAPLMRSEFTISERPIAAWLVVAAGGYARPEINGQEISPSILSPGFTDYDARAHYTVSDVASALRVGPNVFGFELGRGFFGVRERNEWDWHVASWRAEPCVRALLVMDFGDGVRRALGTDGTWVAHDGPTRFNDLFAGEDYDDRCALDGWSEPGTRTDRWVPARQVDGPRGRLEPQPHQPIAVVEEFAPTRVDRVGPTSWLFEFPRVIAGWVTVDVDGLEGDLVEIRMGERLAADGLPDVSDPHGYFAGRLQTHRLTLAGRSLTWRPRFTYQGFQYVLVTAPSEPRIRASLVHTAVARTSSFSSSSPTLNRLHELTVRTVLNNLHGYPTDTPTYEKNGWTGDGMLGAELMLMNLDAHAVLAKWSRDIADSRRGRRAPSVIAPDGGWRVDWTPAPPWHSALVLVPWWIDLYRGDRTLLRELWPSIADYVSFEYERSPGGIASTTLGDWVTPETSPSGGNPAEDSDVPATAFLFAMLRVCASVARRLGEPDSTWITRAKRVRDAYRQAFLGASDGVVRGRRETHYRQTHSVLALAFGLIPRNLEASCAAALAADVRSRGGHLNTGALGTKWLLPVLTRHGYEALALEVAEQLTFPGWGHWVAEGATTLWEHWHPDSRSRNHYFLGTIDDWLFHDVAGLRPTSPGWQTFEVAPRLVGQLGFAGASVDTPFGLAAVRWTRRGTQVDVSVQVPSGTRATVRLDGVATVLPSGEHELSARIGAVGEP